MAFDFNTLEPFILNILSAPDIDLETISARRVRHQLPDLDSSLTPQFLKKNKDDVDAVIARVYEKVSAGRAGGSRQVEETEATPRKRKLENDTEDGKEDGDDEEKVPQPKKARKAGKTELSDAELARRLNDEINSRSRRTTTKSRVNAGGTGKRGGRTKKSSSTVESDEASSDDEHRDKKPKKKRSTGGSAKGGFAKEYALSEPLATLLNIDKLSRPQVVKHLWVYIKENGLQNPDNKKEILCDTNLKAVFGVDKIDMFRMNKVLGQHLHESEG